ncbi:MAG TPA: hypothetical protein VFN67_24335 [Polyangiales bacterium]|nr:hypothetical protein [Polyangiales bacterium]
MTRLSIGSGRWLALFSLSACTSGYVLDPHAPRAAMSEVVPPMAAAGAGHAAEPPPPSAAAAAGTEALQMHVAPQGGSDAHVQRPLPEHVLGVTVTDVGPLDGITDALRNLAQRPTTRIVFDARRQAITYVPAARELHAVSYVMGELVDSVDVADVSLDVYAARTTDYLDELSDLVDIWEVGNEVNGEWLGPSEKVKAKIYASYKLVKERDRLTALTLYFNQGCVQQPDHELFTWAANNIPEDMRQGLDYVWISYYEQRCHGQEPDWESVFTRLHEQFPHAKLGFGGCGTSVVADKAKLVRHFYGLEVDAPNFVGGYFWWYFREDMQPASAPLWTVLNHSWISSPL